MKSVACPSFTWSENAGNLVVRISRGVEFKTSYTEDSMEIDSNSFSIIDGLVDTEAWEEVNLSL